MPAPESARRPNIDVVLSPSERRERTRAALLAEKARERKIEHVGTIIGYVVTITLALLVALVLAGALTWAGIWLWTNLPL